MEIEGYEFREFPKIPRLNRDIVITEKIDGINGQILVLERGMFLQERAEDLGSYDNSEVEWEDLLVQNGAIPAYINGGNKQETHVLFVGSRNRWLQCGKDNFGFWQWVSENANELCKLGHGRHFGEWWGLGIQRGYELKEKRFSLFNTTRWKDNPDLPKCIHVVPVLYQGEWEYLYEQGGRGMAPMKCIDDLSRDGSKASPGFMDPEGIVVFHSHSGQLFKATCKNDEKPKGEKRA